MISIPKIIRESEAFRKGSRLAILAYDDYIELRPMNQIDKKMETAIASERVLAKDWNSKEEDKAWKDL